MCIWTGGPYNKIYSYSPLGSGATLAHGDTEARTSRGVGLPLLLTPFLDAFRAPKMSGK
jgi:hypothetical protein